MKHACLALVSLALPCAAQERLAHGQTPHLGWSDAFGLRGVDGTVEAWALFDDGSGAALYVGGSFRAAGPSVAYSLARWDGAHWAAVALPAGLSGVQDLCVHDDGSGRRLFVASGGGVAAWDGADWEAWMTTPYKAKHAAWDLLSTEGALYFGGRFASIDGVNALNVATWDGTTVSSRRSDSTAPSVANRKPACGRQDS